MEWIISNEDKMEKLVPDGGRKRKGFLIYIIYRSFKIDFPVFGNTVGYIYLIRIGIHVTIFKNLYGPNEKTSF